MAIDAREPRGLVTIAMIGVTAKVPNRVDHVTRILWCVLATCRLTLTPVDKNQIIEYPSPYRCDERVLLNGEDLSDLVPTEVAENEIDAMLGNR